jgi:glycine/D-amino acid oxidase-like deaminating enzyme
MTWETHADVAIIGGSLGGCAAALAACRLGRTVVMTEETAWIGGQLTSQTVPPDEHRFIEYFGSSDSYRRLRELMRDYYRRNFPLTAEARSARWLNPANHECSSLACEPRASLAALMELLARTFTAAASRSSPGTSRSRSRSSSACSWQAEPS